MGRTIEKIQDNEHFEYKGDVVVTGSIGKNATVIIKDGSLTIGGNIDEGTDINLISEASGNVVISNSSNSFFMNGNSISFGGSPSRNVHVQGNVEKNVIIKSKSADITIDGNVGNNAKFETQSGDISASNVGNNVAMKTMSGDISVKNVGNDTSLKTMSGDVGAGTVGQRSTLKTMSGDVKVQSAHETSTLETMSGNIYENGAKRRKERASNSGSSISIGNMSIGGMSFIGGSTSRFIVNGRDITDLVNSSSSSSSTQADEEPIIFSKTF
jgi:hypothetical protein